MTERQHRPRVFDPRPPSRHMRSLLRQAIFGVQRVLRLLRAASSLNRLEVAEVQAVLELCRRAGARDRWPRELAALRRSVPPGPEEAIAALSLALMHLAAIDIVWCERLVAAGIDPEWRYSGA